MLRTFVNYRFFIYSESYYTVIFGKFILLLEVFGYFYGIYGNVKNSEIFLSFFIEKLVCLGVGYVAIYLLLYGYYSDFF